MSHSCHKKHRQINALRPFMCVYVYMCVSMFSCVCVSHKSTDTSMLRGPNLESVMV